MTAFALYILIAYFAFRFIHTPPLKYLIIIASFLLIIAVGLSRIYLGVHYPSDVLAGYIASFWWLANILFIRRTLHHYGQYSEE